MKTNAEKKLPTRHLTIEDKRERDNIYIETYMETGNRSESARRAGYSVTNVTATHNRLRDKIEQAMRDAMSDDARIARKVLQDIALNGSNEASRVAAAKDLMSRAGYDATIKTANISDTRSDAELIEAIKSGLASNDTPESLKTAIKMALGIVPDNVTALKAGNNR